MHIRIRDRDAMHGTPVRSMAVTEDGVTKTRRVTSNQYQRKPVNTTTAEFVASDRSDTVVFMGSTRRATCHGN
jgi:hypothetical protein